MTTLYYWALYVFGPLAVLDCVLRLASLRARRKNSAAAKLGWARRREKAKHRAMWENNKCGIWKE